MEREIINHFTEIDWGLKAINAPEAWKHTKGEGVKILLIDTGVDSSHIDLKHSIIGGYNYIDRNKNIEDFDGHGTHIAGLITGKNTGVAPESKIYVIKSLNNNARGTVVSVMEGITYAIYHRYDVICMSLGMQRDMPLIMSQKISDAYSHGITVVSAVGNNNSPKPLNPARMNEVIGVGGLDKNMSLTNFSNRGYDVLAPSVEILSTYKDGNYARMSGTSMSAPLVTGGIALLISHYRNKGIELKPKEIKELIKGKLDLGKIIV